MNTKKRSAWIVTTLVTVGALSIAPVGAWATASTEDTEQEGEQGATTGEAHEAAEGHGEEHHHKNHVALFVGSTEAEEHHGIQEDRDFTLGFDYGRRLSKLVGVGVLVDYVVEGNREYMVGVPLYLHIGRHAKFQLAPAFHHLSHSGENEFVFRTGFLWDFYVGKMTLSPAIFYDFTENQDFIVFGLNIGTGF